MAIFEVVNAFDKFYKFHKERFIFFEEFFGNSFNIKGLFEFIGNFGDGNIAIGVKLRHVRKQSREFGNERIARLPFQKEVISVNLASRCPVFILRFHPMPNRLATVFVHKNQEVFLLNFLDMVGNLRSNFAVRNISFGHRNLKNNRPRKLCDGFSGKNQFLMFVILRGFIGRIRPIKFFDKQFSEVEIL